MNLPRTSLGYGLVASVALATLSASVPLGNLAALQTGTPFLTQSHDDLGAILDAELTALGDDPSISTIIDSQIAARISSACPLRICPAQIRSPARLPT